MNALITLSEKARKQLQRGAAMDDLDYHLLVLESGCRTLDQTLALTHDDPAEIAAYRDYLMQLGWWDFYTMFWRSFEIRIAAEWYGPESLVPMQSDGWRRSELIKEADTLYHTAYYDRAFEGWLKSLGDRIRMVRTTTIEQRDQQLEHHV